MVVTVEDGRITRIDGDPDNPATRRPRVPEGDQLRAARVAPDRLLHPLRRTAAGRSSGCPGTRRSATSRRGSSACGATAGPEAVLYYDASGSHGALGRLAMAFWHQFGGCTLTYGDLCWPAGLEATRLTYGANLHNHPRLTTDSRFILLWGHNPAETNVHQMRLDPRRAGARRAPSPSSIRAAPTRTDAADLHLQPRPGTDAALALGMARVIVDAGPARRGVPRARTRRASTATSIGSATTRSSASPSITGLPADAIRRPGPRLRARTSPRCSSPASASSATTTRARR